MADNSIKILIEAQNKASKELQAVKKELEGLKKATKDTGTQGGQSIGGLLDQFKALKMGALPYLAAIGGAVAVFKKAIEFGEEGAALEYASLKFERLADAAGTTSEVLLKDLKEATKGTRSEMELMAGAGDFMALGLAKSHDEVVRLTNVASALGMNMNQLVLTLTNQTTMRFDAIGVSVDGFKEKVKALEDAGMSASDAFKEAFLRQAEEQIERVGDAADTTMGTFQKLDAATKDLGDNLKKNLADLLAQDVIPALTQLIRTMNDNVVSAENSSRVMDEYKAAFEAGAITAEEYAAAQDKIRLAINYLQDPTELLIQMTKDLAVANDITGRAVDMTAENLIAQSIAAAQAKDDMSGIADATKVALASLQTLSAEYEKQKGILEKDLVNAYGALGEAATNFKTGVAGDLVKGLEDAGLKGDDMLERLQLIDQFAGTQYAVDFMMDMEMPELLKALLENPDSFLTEAEKFKDYFLPLQNSYKAASQDIDALKRQLEGLERTYTAQVEVVYSVIGVPSQNTVLGGTSGGGGGTGTHFNLHAAGGLVHAAAGAMGKQAYYVGELGPEPFFPAQDGRIISNHEAKSALRSGRGGGESIIVNINTPMNFADQLWVENELAPYIRKGVQDVMARG